MDCEQGEKVEAPVKKVIPPPPEKWVEIHFKLLNWKFMNFSMKFREQTHVFTLKKLLQERHGRIDDLTLCFHAYAEANEIKDEMMTLKQCGLKGAPLEKPSEEELATLAAAAGGGAGDASDTATNPTASGAAPHTENGEADSGGNTATNGGADDGGDGSHSPTPPQATPMSPSGKGSAVGTYRIPQYQLLYDFKPANFSDPVVLYFH